MISQSRAGFPRGPLARQDDRKAIEVGHDAPIDAIIDREQGCLVRKQLADGNSLFALLRELWPIRTDRLVVVEPTSRVGNGEGHRCQAFGGRVHHDHRVLLPWLTRLFVPDTTPDVDDLFARFVDTASAAKFSASSEIFHEGFANGFKSAANVPLNIELV